MECAGGIVSVLSWSLVILGFVVLRHQTRDHVKYGRYAPTDRRCCSAPLAWFLQEVPAFLLPLLLLLLTTRGPTEAPPTEAPSTGDLPDGTGAALLLWTFMLHYFYRSVIYAFRTRGRPVPLRIVAFSATFCSINGFLQGYHLLHCARFQDSWSTRARLVAGVLLFAVGLSININSDNILRRLRKPGEQVYRIPQGGMFEFVSGANFFGEIVEWVGFSVAAWSLPAFAFTFLTFCSIGPRAIHHHRDYLKRFDNYPRNRKAVIPFIM